MLVLSRKEKEAIFIGDDIKVKILSIDKGIVKLGVDAPATVAILREELKDEIVKQNTYASITVKEDILKELVGQFSKNEI